MRLPTRNRQPQPDPEWIAALEAAQAAEMADPTISDAAGDEYRRIFYHVTARYLDRIRVDPFWHLLRMTWPTRKLAFWWVGRVVTAASRAACEPIIDAATDAAMSRLGERMRAAGKEWPDD